MWPITWYLIINLPSVTGNRCIPRAPAIVAVHVSNSGIEWRYRSDSTLWSEIGITSTRLNIWHTTGYKGKLFVKCENRVCDLSVQWCVAGNERGVLHAAVIAAVRIVEHTLLKYTAVHGRWPWYQYEACLLCILWTGVWPGPKLRKPCQIRRLIYNCCNCYLVFVKSIHFAYALRF